MVTTTADLNLHPDLNGNVKIFCSQYDNALREIVFNIYDGDTLADLSGLTAKVEGTKPDKYGYSYDATIRTANSTVTVTLVTQMTCVAGLSHAEIVLYDDDSRVGTANFLLMVEEAGISDDTIVSDSVIPGIHNIDTLVEYAQTYADNAEASALEAEGYAVGTQNGTEVESGSTYYQNNAKYYSEHAFSATPEGYNALVTQVETNTDDINNASTGLKIKVTALETQNGSDVLTTTAQTLSGAVNELVTDDANIINLIKTGFVTPEMFGAVGNGVDDDTLALQSAIDFAENNKCKLLLNQSYITSTLHIKKPINIDGTGKVKAVPYAYTTLASNCDAGSEQIVVSDASKMHVNQTIIVGTASHDLMVITGINGNTIDVKHSPLDNPTVGMNTAHYTNDNVVILNTVFFVTKNIYYVPDDVEADGTAGISDVVIKNIEIEGNISGYDVSKMTAWENFGGQLIMLFRTENCYIDNVEFHDGGISGIADIGYSNNNKICNCHGYNFTGTHYGSGATEDRLEACACITVHWDTGVNRANRDSYNLTIENNILDNAQVGVFLSAVHNSNVINNKVNNAIRRGIFCYAGDYDYGFCDSIVDGNTIKSSVSGSIGLYLKTGSTGNNFNNVFSNNSIYTDVGIKCGLVKIAIISGNVIDTTSHNIDIFGVLGGLKICNNQFYQNNTNNRINFNTGEYVLDEVVFSNNTWIGAGISSYMTNSFELSSDSKVYFIGEAFIGCRMLRLTGGKLRLRFCSSNENGLFGLIAERTQADIFMCQEDDYYYSSESYLSADTATRLAYPNTRVIPIGFMMFDTDQNKVYVYKGSNAWEPLN